jgi:hypothetical protein
MNASAPRGADGATMVGQHSSASKRMIKIRADITELNKPMVNASQALPAPGSQENDVVSEELTKLDQSLNQSSRILADILNQHQKAQDDGLAPPR